MNLLMIEDDPPVLGKALRRGLMEAGHECVWIRNGLRGLEQARAQQFDAIGSITFP